jgi:hypothetical protein
VRPDYDLSGLEAPQADLWLFRKANTIRDEIVIHQVKRQGFTLFAGGELEELFDCFTQPSSPAVSPGSPAFICPYAVSLWVH